MTVQKTSGGLDFEDLRRAYERRDADLALSLYADDAQVLMIDHSNPPSSPLELRGKAEIGEHLRDVFGREMTHRLENEVIGDERVAFNLSCQYPDGNRVFCAGMFEVRDGKIIREVDVQAWDE